MGVSTVDVFETSLNRHDVSSERVTLGAVEQTIERVVEPPAIGVELSLDDTRLPSTVVTAPTPAELEAAKTGVTRATYGVAEYGTVVLESTASGTEQASLFPEHHVAVLRERDIVPDMAALFGKLGRQIRAGRSSVVLATGPSATADMGALVKGAHGPKRVTVLVVTDSERSDE